MLPTFSAQKYEPAADFQIQSMRILLRTFTIHSTTLNLAGVKSTVNPQQNLHDTHADFSANFPLIYSRTIPPHVDPKLMKNSLVCH